MSEYGVVTGGYRTLTGADLERLATRRTRRGSA
jgi:hypothetical protein